MLVLPKHVELDVLDPSLFGLLTPGENNLVDRSCMVQENLVKLDDISTRDLNLIYLVHLIYDWIMDIVNIIGMFTIDTHIFWSVFRQSYGTIG